MKFVKLHFRSVSLRLELKFPWRVWDEMLVLDLGVETEPEATDGEEFAQGMNENGMVRVQSTGSKTQFQRPLEVEVNAYKVPR